MQKTKILFNTINIIFIIFYIYPGSILGYLFYREIHLQPQLSPDFMYISSNHLYVFILFSLTGLIAYYKSKKLFIINYLILASVILEVLHLVIPNRAFQYDDLFGNIAGVLLAILLFNIYNFWRKK